MLNLVSSRKSPNRLLPGVVCFHPEVVGGVLRENGQWHDLCRSCGAYWPEDRQDRKPLPPWPHPGNPLSSDRTTRWDDGPEAPEYD